MKPKVGDIVTLKPMRVVETNYLRALLTNDDAARYEGTWSRTDMVWVRCDAIASIEPLPFKVGDRVEWGEWDGIKRTGIVRAIEAGTLAVWVGREFRIIPADAATRIGDA